MHSTEFPNGDEWGKQCTGRQSKRFRHKDDIGIISYGGGWGGGAGPGVNGAVWDFPSNPNWMDPAPTASSKRW